MAVPREARASADFRVRVAARELRGRCHESGDEDQTAQTGQ